MNNFALPTIYCTDLGDCSTSAKLCEDRCAVGINNKICRVIASENRWVDVLRGSGSSAVGDSPIQMCTRSVFRSMSKMPDPYPTYLMPDMCNFLNHCMWHCEWSMCDDCHDSVRRATRGQEVTFKWMSDITKNDVCILLYWYLLWMLLSSPQLCGLLIPYNVRLWFSVNNTNQLSLEAYTGMNKRTFHFYFGCIYTKAENISRKLRPRFIEGYKG